MSLLDEIIRTHFTGFCVFEPVKKSPESFLSGVLKLLDDDHLGGDRVQMRSETDKVDSVH